MQETDKILERLTKKIDEVDKQFNNVKFCSKRSQAKLSSDVQGLNETEDNLEDKLKALKERESELDKLNALLDKQKNELNKNSKSIHSQCKWYEIQMKSLFCRDFIYEIVYKIEKEQIELEEKKLSQTKISSVQTFEKIGKNLKNFEDLKTKFLSEAKIINQIKRNNYRNIENFAGKRSSSEKYVKVGCRKGNLTPCLSRCIKESKKKKNVNQFSQVVDYLQKHLNMY